ncbi:hypothetical protein ACGFYU_22865 [Streptomyces sp. NPDC048337]|uniref:hypothetical protein n=1 Tax=Streptomyces sp. NPDC048337 TaxID=3365535 RepID=UPI0037148059
MAYEPLSGVAAILTTAAVSALLRCGSSHRPRKGDRVVYMMRQVFRAERGKAPEIVEAFKNLTAALGEAGYTNRRIYVDYAGPMDTVVCQWEFDSLDQYFTMERGFFVDQSADVQSLVKTFNSYATSGLKEIYEVIQ